MEDAVNVTKQALTRRQTAVNPANRLITDLLGPAMKKQFEMGLPAHLKANADRYIRCFVTAIRTNPKLGACTRESLFGAMMTIVGLGLDPSLELGEAYIQPYKDKATFVIGYKGMVALAYRGGVKKIVGHEVRENDQFEISWGCCESLRHIPNLRGDRGEVTGYYVVATMPNGEKLFNYMTKKEVVDRAKKFSPSYNYGSSPWQTDFDSMALKTCLRALFKWLPKSTEAKQALAKDDSIINANEDEADGVLDIEAEHPELMPEPEREGEERV